ncbi:hypothetical protein H2200_011191 [Cladophialophora chaetospira]|uniref:Uncharacterized protein n=1 Tax=Cladophialophora chaetospira TaxID=386627 RepID=A0AA39CDN3_9EURO|nr:hypothetical protein H2200_011191 [Cladophialophora chaetospira]
MQNIREKLKRRLSHKDAKETDFDDADSADEETIGYVTKDVDEAEESNQDFGKPGSFLNRLILHGNKKTEDQLAREHAERQRMQAAGAGTTGTSTTTGTTGTVGSAQTDRQVTQQ